VQKSQHAARYSNCYNSCVACEHCALIAAVGVTHVLLKCHDELCGMHVHTSSLVARCHSCCAAIAAYITLVYQLKQLCNIQTLCLYCGSRCNTCYTTLLTTLRNFLCFLPLRALLLRLLLLWQAPQPDLTAYTCAHKTCRYRS
jgi:hypothetical protein